jgi:hypothetical protein
MIRSKTKLHSRVIKTVTVGDIAQLHRTLKGTALDGGGKTVEVSHKAIEVLRCQPTAHGSSLWAIPMDANDSEQFERKLWMTS